MKTISTFIVSLAVTALAHSQTPAPTIITDDAVKTTARQSISMAGLPLDARKFIKENFAVRGVRYVTKGKNSENGTIYEVGVSLEGKLDVLQFNSAGELVSEEVRK